MTCRERRGTLAAGTRTARPAGCWSSSRWRRSSGSRSIPDHGRMPRRSNGGASGTGALALLDLRPRTLEPRSICTWVALTGEGIAALDEGHLQPVVRHLHGELVPPPAGLALGP